MAGNREFSFFIAPTRAIAWGGEAVLREENAKASPFRINVGGRERGFHHIGGKADPWVKIHI